VATEQKTPYPEFEDAVAGVVKERDFAVLQPWRLGRGEHEMTWLGRSVNRLAGEYGLDKGVVHDKLQAALEARQAQNERKWFRCIAARLHRFYYSVLKAVVGYKIVRPWLYPLHVGNDEERRRTSFRGTLEKRDRDAPPIASIVVLSYNRLAYLRSTLESVFATTPRNDYELIVVDNGSTDGSADALRSLADGGGVDKLILRKSNHGTAPGFNTGFAYSDRESRYVIKLDSDVKLLTPGWLARFDAFFQRVPDAGMLALYQINNYRMMTSPCDVVGGEKVISWNWWPIGSACMTIPRPIFQQLGYFCEDYQFKYIWDDVDYSKRLFLLGRRAYYLRGTRAFHRDELDRYYRSLQVQKASELPKSRELQKKAYREYVIGERDISIFYPHYEDRVFPSGERVIEID